MFSENSQYCRNGLSQRTSWSLLFPSKGSKAKVTCHKIGGKGDPTDERGVANARSPSNQVKKIKHLSKEDVPTRRPSEAPSQVPSGIPNLGFGPCPSTQSYTEIICSAFRGQVKYCSTLSRLATLIPASR